MNAAAIGVLVFGLTFGGVLLGMRLRTILPDDHVTGDSRTTINVAAGLIATLTALILGLVTASAKESFDELDRGIEATSSQLLSVDRTLARYGPDADEIRQGLKVAVGRRIEALWPDKVEQLHIDPSDAGIGVERLAQGIRALTPQNADQRWLQKRATERCEALLENRWMVVSAMGGSIPRPFLGILMFWLTITFTSFGLFAPRNATVLVALFVCAVSVAASVFLIVELDSPFNGLIVVSPDPVRFAFAHIGQ